MSRNVSIGWAVFLLFAGVAARAQEILKIDERFACAAESHAPLKEATLLPSTDAALRILRDIVAYVGLSADNIDLRASDVSSAIAYLDPVSGRRLILYNEDFVRRLQTGSGSVWAARAILAHELAHHLNNHLQLTAADRRRVEELEADRFAGHVLFKMAADIKAVTAVFSELKEGDGYPARNARIAAATNGWWIAKEQGGYPGKGGAVDVPKIDAAAPRGTLDGGNQPPTPSVPTQASAPKVDTFSLLVEQQAFVPHAGGLMGGPGISFSIQGKLHAPAGSTFQIVITFALADGRGPLFPHPQENHYRGMGNLLATGSAPGVASVAAVDLAQIRINPIPHYTLNLMPTGYQYSYPIAATAHILVNGVIISAAPAVRFDVRW